MKKIVAHPAFRQFLGISLIALISLAVHGSLQVSTVNARSTNEVSSSSESEVNFDDPNLAMTNGYVSEAATVCLPSQQSGENAGENLEECMRSFMSSMQNEQLAENSKGQSENDSENQPQSQIDIAQAMQPQKALRSVPKDSPVTSSSRRSF